MDVSLRRLQTVDIDQVIEIEREAFSPLWVTTPFKRELNNRYACYLVACEAAEEEEPPTDADPEGPRSLWSRVLTSAQRLVPGSQGDSASPTPIAGYVSVWYQGDEAHITEIAVREGLRGNGIGELLLIGSLREAVEYGSEVMTLEVRVSNFIAQRLYEKYGFKNVGARKAYYADNREDAVIMTTSPIKSEEYQSMFRDLQETYLTKWGEIRFQSKTTGSSQS
ncbi:MAG: ribosomal protein S18-alanine N-acetyltransferase [Chloroflexi bacterium]|nr:ribosomal protein S18-alanine N-acetyltransferase [Chloroflexota bacterium]